MPDPTLDIDTTNNPVIDYISQKYYNGGEKDKLYKKFTTDQASLEKAIAETHIKYSKDGQTLGEFESEYYAKYGNPFAEKKKPTPSMDSQNLVQSNQNENQEFENQKKLLQKNQLFPDYKPQVNESVNGSNNPSFEEWKALPENQWNDRSELEDKVAYENFLANPNPIGKVIDENEMGRTRSGMNTFTKAVYSLPADIAEVSAILGNKLEQYIPIGDQPTVENSQLTKLAKQYRGFLDDQMPTNKAYQGEILADIVPGAAGTLATMLLTGGESAVAKSMAPVVKASKLAAITTKASSIAGKTVQYATSPTAVTAAVQIGASEYNQAINSGATPDQATEVALKNMSVGTALEAVPIIHFFNRLNKTTGGGFTKYLQSVVKTGAIQGTEEAVTEVMQQAYSNYTASETYDQTRSIFDGMKESGGVGFGIGFVLGAMGMSLRRRQEIAHTPEEKAEIQKSIDFVNEKTDDLESGKLSDQGQEIKSQEQPSKTTTEQAKSEVNTEELTNQSETINNVPQEQVNNQENISSESEPIINNENNVEPQNIEQNDQANITGVQSDLGTGKESVQTESVNEPSQEEISRSGNVQINEKQRSEIPEQQSEIKPKTERFIKISIDDKSYSVRNIEGEIKIKNKETKKYINPNSERGKEIIESYKDKIIHRLSQGKIVEPKENISSTDFIKEVIEKSENPSQVAQIWNGIEETPLDAKEQIIKDDLRRMPIDGIYRFGDRKSMSKGMTLNYVKKAGPEIDIQAQEMSNTHGIEITPQDIIDFIQKYPGGTRTAKTINVDKVALGNRFKQLTGFELNKEFANRIDQFRGNYAKTNLPENKWFSEQDMADAILKGENLNKYEFLFDNPNEFKDLKEYVNKAIKKGKYEKSRGTQEYNQEFESNRTIAEEGKSLEEGTTSEREGSGVIGSLRDKIRSLRDLESDSEKERLAKQIIKEVDGQLLNREGVLVDNDGSFALPNSKLFFDLLDAKKSVYLLKPNAKIANDIFDYQIIANQLPEAKRSELMQLMDDAEGDAITFDDAFRLGMMEAAKSKGYDGVLLKEIDGTDSTVHIVNPESIKLVYGEDMLSKNEPVNTRSDAAISIEANKNKAVTGFASMTDLSGITMMGDLLGININDITKKINDVKWTNVFKKWLTSSGFIPESVFKSWIGTQGNINAELTKMKYMVADFRSAIKKAYSLSFGKNISPALSTEINSALAGNKESLSKLPEEVQEKVSEMRAHVDYLSQRMISEGVITGDMIPKFQNNMGIYLFRSYQKHDNPDWVQEIDPQIVNKAVAYIQQQYPEYTQEEIDGVINELLFTPEAPMNLIKNGKLGSKDLSILKSRKDLAPEIRALYGEYADPLVNYSKSIMKMTNLIEKHKFLEKVKSHGMDKFLFEKANKEHYVKLAAEGSTTMAPLNGLYTSPEIAKAFEEFNAKENLPKWMEYYMKAISTIKVAKTILNITTHARNVIGNMSFAIANGHWDLSKTINAVKTIKTDLMDANNDEFRKKYQKYQKLGLVGESSSVGELKAMLDDAKLKPDPYDYVNTKMITKAKKATTDFIGKLYQAEDDFYKIYAYENELSRYKEAYGDTKSQEEVEQIAADIVRNTYPTYSQTSKLIKEMRKAPILGTFISFPAEVIRTTYNTVQQTQAEIKSDNPKIKSIGYQRLAGQMLSASLTAGLSAMTKYLYGISDEEEEEIREFVAPWSKHSVFLYTGPLDSGKVNMIDLTQTDPHGFWQKPILALLDGKGDLKENGLDAIVEILTPFFGLNMVTEALIDAKNNKKTTGQDITNPSLPLGDQLHDYFTYVINFAKPGTLTSIDRIIKGYQLEGQPDEYGKIYNFRNEILAAGAGQRISSIDVATSFSFVSGDMKKKLTNSKDIYDKFKKMEQPYMTEAKKAEIREEREGELNKSVNAIKENVIELRKLYFGAQKLGVTAKDLKNILKANKYPPLISKLIFTETPLEKMEFKVWNVKTKKNESGDIEQYLKRYLEK